MPALCGGNLLVLKQITVHLCGEGGSLWKLAALVHNYRYENRHTAVADGMCEFMCSLGIVPPDSTVLALLQHQNRWQDQNRCQEAKVVQVDLWEEKDPRAPSQNPSDESLEMKRPLLQRQCAANLLAHVPDWYRMNQPLHTMSLHNIRSHSRINPIVLLAHTNHTL